MPSQSDHQETVVIQHALYCICSRMCIPDLEMHFTCPFGIAVLNLHGAIAGGEAKLDGCTCTCSNADQRHCYI